MSTEVLQADDAVDKAITMKISDNVARPAKP